jgi:ankyrin repeat protein
VLKELLSKGALISQEDRGWAVKNAAENGRLDALKELLSKVDVVIFQYYLGLAVKWAAWNGHAAVIKELLSNDALISQEDRGSAVKIAAKKGYSKVVKQLLFNDALISQKDRGWALKIAAKQGYSKIVKQLLSNGVGTFLQDDLCPALKIATEKQYLDVIKLLLDSQVQITTKDRGLLVRLAAFKGRIDVVKKLLPSQAQVPIEDLNRAFVNAVKNGHLSLVGWLVKLFGNSNLKMSEETKEEALRSAASKSDPSVVELLVRLFRISGFEISEETKEAAIRSAASERDLGLAEFMRLGELFSCQTSEYWQGCYLIWAASKGRRDVIKELLGKKSGIDKQYISLALAQAVEHNRLEVVKCFFDNCHRDLEEDIETYILDAVSNGHLKIVEWFFKQEANEPWKQNAIITAIVNGRLKIVEWFYLKSPQIFQDLEFASDLKRVAKNGHLSVLKWLYNRGYKISRDELQSIIEDVLKENRLDLFYFLLTQHHLDQNLRGKLIVKVAQMGYVDVLRLLLDKGPVRESVINSAIRVVKQDELAVLDSSSDILVLLHNADVLAEAEFGFFSKIF